MRFKTWLHLQEAIDQNTEKALLQQKVDANQLNDFINQLKAQPELIDTRSAFVKLQDKFPFLRKDKNFPEAPTDPFFKKYYVQLTEGQITKPEYYTLLFFKDKSQGSLTRMMLSLRNLIQEGKIELNFINNIPTIVYQNEAIPNKDFLQFTGMLHKIEGLDAVTDSLVFHAGTAMDGADVVSAGGRVLAVTSYGRSIEHALDKSYRSIEDIQFKDAYFRSDIGFDLIQLLNK